MIKIKIQKVLVQLENYWKIWPNVFIFEKRSWLHYSGLTQKSDEPLKSYIVQNNKEFL